MKEEELRNRLISLPIFKKLSEEEMKPFTKICKLRFYKQKTFVFSKGDPLNYVFFIYSGKIKIYKTDCTGKEQIISILEQGEMFPHSVFFRHGVYPAHALVLEDAQLVVTPISQFEITLISNPEICIKLFKVLGEKIVELQDRLEEQTLHNTYERIVLLLLRLCKSNAFYADGYYQVTTHFTNKDLANMIGASRETVSRTINELKRADFIKMNDNGLFIIDMERLKQEII